jgi:hypothetical protein
MHSFDNLTVAPITRKTIQRSVHIFIAVSEASTGVRFAMIQEATILPYFFLATLRGWLMLMPRDEAVPFSLAFPVATLANIPIIMEWH